jgi:AmmeMemoRadiSam system protein A
MPRRRKRVPAAKHGSSTLFRRVLLLETGRRDEILADANILNDNGKDDAVSRINAMAAASGSQKDRPQPPKPLPIRLTATLLAGTLFAVLIPIAIVVGGRALDRSIGWPPIEIGWLQMPLAAVLAISGALLALWSIGVQLMRAAGTPIPLLPTQSLLLSPPYSFSRNPMALGTAVAYLGLALGVGTTSGMLLVPAGFGLLLIYILRVEEPELERRFGQPYREYRASTPFLLPGLRWTPKRDPGPAVLSETVPPASKAPDGRGEGSESTEIPRAESDLLLAHARAVVEAVVRGEAPPQASGLSDRRVPGCFVTLRQIKTGGLRGCRGTLFQPRPLAAAVAFAAAAAAIDDPRFPPVRASELRDLAIEISLLTKPRPIEPSQVEVGRHGLVIRLGGRLGLLLPEVAADYGWDVDTYLQAVCAKAGLPPDAWREPSAQLLAFESQAYCEPAWPSRQSPGPPLARQGSGGAR